jgi:uncharacterized protein (TIGR03086 family)
MPPEQLNREAIVAASDTIQYQSDTLTKLIAGIRPDQMDNPTPCGDWDVRALCNHFVGGAGLFTDAFNGEQTGIDPDAPTPDFVGNDPLGAFTGAIAGFNRAVDQPGAMDRLITVPFGQLPGAAIMEILKFDLTVHCWDLAQATGQPFDPPDDVVAAADAVAHQMLSPEMRASGAFGAAAPASPDATPIERLVAFTGRSV